MDEHGSGTNCIIIKYGFNKINPGYESNQSFSKGRRLFEAGHVLDLTEIKDSVACFITSKVVRQTSVSLTPYDVKIEIDEHRTATVCQCTCAAGAGGVCKHIGATIVAINSHTSTSKTDLPQVWGKPTLKNLRDDYAHGKRFEDFYPPNKKYKSNLNEYIQITSSKLMEVPCALRFLIEAEERSASEQVVNELVQEILALSVNTSQADACRHAMWQIVDEQFLTLNIGNTWETLDSSCEANFFQENVRLTPEEVVELSIQTLNQDKSDAWFRAREVRVSASSKAHRIKTRKKDMEKLIDSFFSPKPFKGNAATRYGTKMEECALQAYKKFMCADRPIKIVKCGLIVRESQPWLSASPDGIVIDEDGRVLKLVEVKCPHSCENKPIVNCDDGTSNVKYLTVDSRSGQICLKESDMYYTQVQIQMYVTGLKECDFVVYSSVQTLIINIEINEPFLSIVLPKIEDCYFKLYLPKLVGKDRSG